MTEEVKVDSQTALEIEAGRRNLARLQTSREAELRVKPAEPKVEAEPEPEVVARDNRAVPKFSRPPPAKK